MDIKSLIKDTREILSLNKYNDDQVILSDSDNDVLLENAIYDKWFSKTINEVNQSDDDKKIKRISDVCKESMKYVTMIIKIFVSEYRAAAITCRRILLAGVR